MITIAVGTESALKLQAVKQALYKLTYKDFEIELTPVGVVSCVPVQPMKIGDTLQGALHRAGKALEFSSSSQFGIGIESGLIRIRGKWFDQPCVVVTERSTFETISYGTPFSIPHWVVHEVVTTQTELGEVIKRLSDGEEKDSQNYFSEGAITQEEIIAQAVVHAFIPHLYLERYRKG